jgi:hypothetical protein
MRRTMILSGKPSNSARVGARCLEGRFTLDAPKDSVEYQAMQMDVQVGDRVAAPQIAR